MVQGIVGGLMNSFRRSSSAASLNGIPSPEEFSRILERERERSDRSGQGFSLVVFEYGANNLHTDSMRILKDCILSRKVRAIDEVGWFNEGAIATLLACTSPDGARAFAEDVVANLPPAGIDAPICRVYTYPSSGNGNGDGKRRKDDNDETLRPIDSRESTQPVSAPTQFESEGLEKIMGRPIPLWKRFLDILGALVGLILFSPIFLLIALFIKIVSPGPVFFRQERIGYLGKPFTLWKFRSMHVHNNTEVHLKHISNAIESNTPITKLDALNDNRIIPFGKLIRSSCLDELPQFFNVLRGDMSLIGPRPCLQFEAEKLLPWQKRRFDTLPGMSGLWQISGKNSTTFKEMTRFDIRYSSKLSLVLDAKIILFTVPAILGMVFNRHSKRAAFKQKSVKLTGLHIEMPFQG